MVVTCAVKKCQYEKNIPVYKPVFIAYSSYSFCGTLTDADRKEWGEYLRNRDLSPSIYKQRIYARRHPGDKKDYIIDIKEGKEVLIEVFSK